ncbi:50S ribosomal protein L9 [Thermodesulfovibrio yellowstonii]|uniref:Large ribosomal subunit protein bL9 n=1 Tax=Thermodesulfovibrio yellowstonii (strain ATCC 51303 / DSM 11347 / YP87) TaxID=289376 RepID=RL9_THEYD|nr:50S ribosomal protein L9 [Thermodesulfovibrio yellowstonii]B5YIM4.1 RecName: Full=Large ribosomal subunit protein bL9; AltName: Full=50S ribosomal protein L9 [Thermodesulfovibrio yellowstonii DSM 11347]ACI20510.1 ribosomal protein L9 [Thermodesulfovibrio yellowstonii DSM 11347]
MKVILKEDVHGLGRAGQTINVKDGYARNYLLPRGLALIADEKNLKVLEYQKKKFEEQAKKKRQDAESIAERLSALELTIKAKAGEDQKLFGSITAKDIAELLQKEGFLVDKKQINISEPIKRVGEHEVEVKLLSNLSAKLKINVVAE